MDRYDKTIEEIRKFNRFYTVNMGFLDSGCLDTTYSIAEMRILFEIKTHGTCAQSDITKNLHIDKSYLSRIVTRLCKNGLIEKDRSAKDKRITCITLTEKGTMETERLIDLTDDQIRAQIVQLNLDECEKLCNAMNAVITILGKEETSENGNYTV